MRWFECVHSMVGWYWLLHSCRLFDLFSESFFVRTFFSRFFIQFRMMWCAHCTCMSVLVFICFFCMSADYVSYRSLLFLCKHVFSLSFFFVRRHLKTTFVRSQFEANTQNFVVCLWWFCCLKSRFNGSKWFLMFVVVVV